MSHWNGKSFVRPCVKINLQLPFTLPSCSLVKKAQFDDTACTISKYTSLDVYVIRVPSSLGRRCVGKTIDLALAGDPLGGSDPARQRLLKLEVEGSDEVHPHDGHGNAEKVHDEADL